MLTDPADILIAAARARNGRDTLITRAPLWLFAITAGLPLATGLLDAASAVIG